MSASKNHTTTVSEIKSKVPFNELFRELYPENWHAQGNSRCPFHDDHQASFQVSNDFGTCHAGCRPKTGGKSWDIIALWQAHREIDFKTAVRELAERAGVGIDNAGRKTGGKIVATYDYVDESGGLIFQVCRFEPKDFRQRRPDGKGGWLWQIGNTPRVLYRLPEVLRAETVCICEGEKDADNVFMVGLCGTTAPQGAGKWGKLCKDHRIHEPLKGKTVLILPDNDEAGAQHANAIARTLHGFASSVKILDLKQLWPEIPEKGDVSDYIAHCGTDEARRALLEHAENTPEHEPTEEPEGEADEDSQEKEARPSRFKMLVQLLEVEQIEYFHDQFQNAWACVGIGDHHENIKIKSGRFRTYLTRLFYGAKKEGCGRETLQQVQDLCSAKALFEGEQRTLSVRAAWQGDSILIDLGGPDWKAIQITPEGWSIVQPKHPPFRRFPHMKPLPEPVSGGSIQDVLRVLPIQDETSRILISAWLPTVLIPDIPRPGLILAGLQGSGKTFASERLRELVDPSEHLTQSLSKDAAELVQALDHNYLPSFDNLTGLPLWASDMLCRAVTGGGYSKRELYSDDDDVCYSFCRPFIINGISVSASRPDLLDRVLICELGRISKEDRKPLKRLMAEFRRLRPRVLGAMLDAISGAMRIKDDIQLDVLHRLADWQEWAVAVAEVTGIGQQSFLEALETNIGRQHSEVNTQDPTAVCVLEFMTERLEWTGTPTDLYSELTQIAERMKLDKEQAWPKAPNAFSRKLKGISHNLLAAGVEATGPVKLGHSRDRQIILKRVTVDPTSTPEIPPASEYRPQPNNNSDLARAVCAGDISTEERVIPSAGDISSGNNTIPSAIATADNHQESLLLDDADDADDISRYSAVPDPSEYESKLENWGCRSCLYFVAASVACAFEDGSIDLTTEDALCPRNNRDGTPISVDELPFALAESI